MKAEEKLKWERDLNENSVLYYIGIALAEYAIMNMQSNPLLRHKKKQFAGSKRRQLLKWINEVKSSGIRLNMTDDLKKEDDAVTEKIGAMASICYMISHMPTTEIYTVVDRVEEFCRDGVEHWLQEQVDSGEMKLKIWTMNDGKTYHFVHTMDNIEEVLADFYKDKGKEAPVKDFMIYCRVKGYFITTLDK